VLTKWAEVEKKEPAEQHTVVSVPLRVEVLERLTLYCQRAEYRRSGVIPGQGWPGNTRRNDVGGVTTGPELVLDQNGGAGCFRFSYRHMQLSTNGLFVRKSGVFLWQQHRRSLLVLIPRSAATRGTGGFAHCVSVCE
jgi:hypothetical protein